LPKGDPDEHAGKDRLGDEAGIFLFPFLIEQEEQ
jgi:hypothetical protein